MLPFLLISLWLVCATICAGWIFADFCAIWHPRVSPGERQNLGYAIVCGLLIGLAGPVGILLTWMLSGFGEKGWRLNLTPAK